MPVSLAKFGNRYAPIGDANYRPRTTKMITDYYFYLKNVKNLIRIQNDPFYNSY